MAESLLEIWVSPSVHVQSAAELKNLLSYKAADVSQMIKKTPDLKLIDYIIN